MHCAGLDRDPYGAVEVMYVAVHLRLGPYGVYVGHTTLDLSTRMDNHIDTVRVFLTFTRIRVSDEPPGQ